MQAGSRWYCCDDAWVHCVEEEVVAACQAYMLFYLNRWGARSGGSCQVGRVAPLDPADLADLGRSDRSRGVLLFCLISMREGLYRQ